MNPPEFTSDLSLRPDRFPAALARIDLAELAAQVEANFREHGARTQPKPPGLLFATGKMPGSAMATFVLEGERIARAVAMHVRVPPFFTGLALVVHPPPEISAPVLLADLRILPSGHGRALFDAAGPAIDSPSFEESFGRPLARIVDEPLPHVRRAPVPAWLAHVSGGGGASLRSEPGSGAQLAGVFARYVDAYLRGLAAASSNAQKPAANEAAARVVRDLARSNAPAKRWLSRTFGEALAERSLRLLWREDR